MTNHSTILTPGRLAFIALANEYCKALESARESTPAAFTAEMTRLLPRIYMAAADLKNGSAASIFAPDDEAGLIIQALDEDYYEAVRTSVETLLGPDDVYLETFEADMKYSDTPIGACISESLADIFQSLYNFTETVREADVDSIPAIIDTIREDFESYWSQTLCNVMRPLNHLRYTANLDDADDDADTDN